MMRRLKPGLGRFSVTALAVVAVGAGVAVPTLAAQKHAARTSAQPAAQPAGQVAGQVATTNTKPCLIVDSDVGLDDFRALAVLLPHRDVRAVIATEGISGVQNGANAVSLFLASRGKTPAVIAGQASATPPAYDWLPAARAGAERIDNYLAAAVPSAEDPGGLKGDVQAAISGCGRVDVLVLGPWTSYLRYAGVLGSDVHVIASGRSFAENNPDNFNCEYDLPACRSAVPVLRNARSVAFVDLPPAGSELTYDPTEAMILQFERNGMPGLLRTALQVDPSQWLGTRLWDDAAAYYLVAPWKYVQRGGHVEPNVAQDAFRTLLVNSVNAG